MSFAIHNPWVTSESPVNQWPGQGNGPGAEQQPTEPGQHLASTSTAAMIREGCLTRMRRFSHGHASLAAEPPRGRAPGPHGLLFLYAWPTARHPSARPEYEVAAG